MEDKYYTPSEQELIEHVINGETIYFKSYDSTLVGITPSGNVSDLIDFIYENGSVLDNRPYGLDESYFRIKHLDKSDIEELGWEFLSGYSDKDKDKEVMTFTKRGWVIVYNFTLKKIFIFVKDYSKEPGLFGSARDVKVSGLGVKNKSELKRLIRNLKMGE